MFLWWNEGSVLDLMEEKSSFLIASMISKGLSFLVKYSFKGKFVISIFRIASSLAFFCRSITFGSVFYLPIFPILDRLFYPFPFAKSIWQLDFASTKSLTVTLADKVGNLSVWKFVWPRCQVVKLLLLPTFDASVKPVKPGFASSSMIITPPLF